MNNELINFPSKDNLANHLAKDIADLLNDAISKNGRATILFSGGSTPKLFLNRLSILDIEWDKVCVGLVDERWVDAKSEDSNENLIRTQFLKNNASSATFVGMYEEKDILEAEISCSQTYKNEFSEIDVLVLGMGTDGHTASLFPNNEKLDLAYDLKQADFCISITPETAPYDRMSLSLKSILNAKNLFLQIEGNEKLEVYNKVIKSSDEKEYPVLKVLNSKNNVKVYAYE